MKPISFDVDISGISSITFEFKILNGSHQFAISDVGLYQYLVMIYNYYSDANR